MYQFTAPLWIWQGDGPASWHFITVPPDIADDIEQESEGMRGGFGSVKVNVTVGSTTWSTSLFPSKTEESYLLPVKKSVRVNEELDDGDDVTVSLELV